MRETVDEYLKRAAQLFGYPTVDCIGDPRELEIVGRVVLALIEAESNGFIRGVKTLKESINGT
jgi:hypothetical protein